MRFWRFGIFLSCIFTFSNGYNLTNQFEKFSLPNSFVDSIQDFIRHNEDTISKQCALDMKQYIRDLLTPKLWAWLMFDAGTKIPSGMLSGNIFDLGQFDQCINIEKPITENQIIFGKYCLGTVALGQPKAYHVIDAIPEIRMVDATGVASGGLATCMPNSCSASDIQEFYSWSGIAIDFTERLCQSKSTQSKLSAGDIATITFFVIIFAIMLISTAYDAFLHHHNRKPAHLILIAFSVLSNGKKLLETGKNSSQIPCLWGIRVMSMMWVILGHRYSMGAMLPTTNFVNILQWMFDVKNMFVMGATVSVDTFFVLGGLVISYSCMTSMSKGDKFNIFAFYIHRYLRLTPLLAVMAVIYITILNKLGSGPLWNSFIASYSNACKNYWWSLLLYVQNYVNPMETCIGQSWYLSVDTQLFVLSPIILLPMAKNPKIGVSLTAVLVFISILTDFLIGWFYDLRGFLLANVGDDYLVKYYLPTHTRAGPWLIGILLGYFIYQLKQNHKKLPMNKALALTLWLISLVILAACVYTGHNTLELSYEYDKVANSVYIALMRNGWALGLCWVVIACVIGYGGPVNWFLSLPIFQVLARLTYSMYLTHNAIQLLIDGQLRRSNYFSNLNLLYAFWGDFMFTFGVAIIFTLAFESPIIIIEKLIFGNGRGNTKQSLPTTVNENKIQVP